MIKFNKFNITNTETKQKARVRYSIGNHISGRDCVTIYHKDYSDALRAVMAGADGYKNDTDTMADYFDKGRVVLFSDHPLYAQALDQAQR